MMKTFACRKTRPNLEQYCQGLLSPDRAVTVENHIRHCPACSREYEEIQKILNHLAAHRLPDPGETFWNRMRGDIMTQVSEVPVQADPWYKRFWAAPFQWPGYAWATALVLLVLVPVSLYTMYAGKNFTPLPEALVAESNLETGVDPMFSRLEGLSNQESERLGKRVVAVLVGEVKNNLPRGEEDDWSWDAAVALESLDRGELEAVAKKLKTRYPTG